MAKGAQEKSWNVLMAKSRCEPEPKKLFFAPSRNAWGMMLQLKEHGKKTIYLPKCPTTDRFNVSLCKAEKIRHLDLFLIISCVDHTIVMKI